MSVGEVHRRMILIMEKKLNSKRKEFLDRLRLSETLSLLEMIDHEADQRNEKDQEHQNEKRRKKRVEKRANLKMSKKTDAEESQAPPRLRRPAHQAHHLLLLLHQMDLSLLEKPESRIRKGPEENLRKRAALLSDNRLAK